MEIQPPLPAFYSYAHKRGRDRGYLEKLRDALSGALRAKLIAEWDDRELRSGDDWEEKIIAKAVQSRVFLFILTDRFIGSDFCVDRELTIGLHLREKRAAVVALIEAEMCDWRRGLPQIAKFLLIRPYDKPVNKSRDGWAMAAQSVGKAVEDFLAGKLYVDSDAQPPIPPLLPFTIGRGPVIEQFTTALTAAPRIRPLVCILTGEGQGQAELIDYLLSEDGPVRSVLTVTGARYDLEIDSAWACSTKPVEPLLNAALAARVEPAPLSPDRAGIGATLSGLGLSVMRCALSAGEWRACGAARLKEFVDYWAGWPNLKNSSPTIVFLNIDADTGNLATPGGFCVPLPSLTEKTTIEWLKTPEVQRRFLAGPVLERLRTIFGTQTSLPMNVFVGRIADVLRNSQVR